MKHFLPQVWIVADTFSQSASLLHLTDLEHSIRSGIDILEDTCQSEMLVATWTPYRSALLSIIFTYIARMTTVHLAAGLSPAKPDKYLEKIRKFYGQRDQEFKRPSFMTDTFVHAHKCNLWRMAAFQAKEAEEQSRIQHYLTVFPEEIQLSIPDLRKVLIPWPDYARKTGS